LLVTSRIALHGSSKPLNFLWTETGKQSHHPRYTIHFGTDKYPIQPNISCWAYEANNWFKINICPALYSATQRYSIISFHYEEVYTDCKQYYYTIKNRQMMKYATCKQCVVMAHIHSQTEVNFSVIHFRRKPVHLSNTRKLLVQDKKNYTRIVEKLLRKLASTTSISMDNNRYQSSTFLLLQISWWIYLKTLRSSKQTITFIKFIEWKELTFGTQRKMLPWHQI